MNAENRVKNRTDISDRLKKERARLKLTQAQMADLANSTERTYQDWEAALSTPKADNLSALASAGVDVAYVLAGKRTAVSTQNGELTPEESALLDNYRNAGERGQAAARAVLATLAQPEGKRSSNGGK